MDMPANTTGPSVSVVIPAFNAAAWLPRAIDSALAQTVKPCEIIVADDGSTDATAEVVSRYGDAARYVRFNHCGVYAVRNAILAELKGTWFLNLDADNWIEPDFLAKALEVVEAHADDDAFAFVYPDMQRFGEAEDGVERPDFSVEKLKTRNYLDMNSLIRTDVARRFGFDPAFNSGQGDYDFFLTLVENGFIGAPLRSSRLHYCVHPGSISYEGRRRFRHRLLAEQIIEKHVAFFSEREAAALRDGARRGSANAMWDAALEEYEAGRYREVLRYARIALRCDVRMVSRARARLLFMSLVVCGSAGILCLSRPVQFGESRLIAPARILLRACRKAWVAWSALAMRLGRVKTPKIWIDLDGGPVGRDTPRIRTRRSVELQDYRNWRWLVDGETPAEDDYIVRLRPGDELYPESLFMLAREAARRASPDLVYGDHAWWNGERSLQPCWKPDFPQSEIVRNLDVLRGAALVKAGLRSGEGAGVSLPEAGPASVVHVPDILMNLHVPCEAPPPQDAFVPDSSLRVAVVIPTKNRAALLARCVQSLRARTAHPALDIVIVDNGSTDEDAVDFLSQCGERVVRHPAPFNFSELVNLGARATDAPALLLLNDDIEVPPGAEHWLGAMVATLMEDHVGIVGARLDYPCGATQHAGIGVFHAARGRLRMRNLFCGQMNRSFWVGRRRDCLAVTGACQLVRREAFETVKGYDEALPVVCNDVDFCLRVRELGWRVVYQPEARLIHHEGVSKGGSRAHAESVARSHALFDARWAKKIARDTLAREEWETGL